ncbi:MAG: tRNA (cytidine(34)-2'-O)-methyltransferase [Magnetococcales bacterium]|nr:tRNA (cytidine(34)-2'-O)-methyltransferase [Magnetococcales bacterium]
MFHVMLYQPEIPPNTGTIIRLCAASNTRLHLIGPLGFRLDAAAVKRAGMDYRELADVQRWADWAAYRDENMDNSRTFVISTHGKQPYSQPEFRAGDRFLFGSEGAGLPDGIKKSHGDRVLRIPMAPQARSLNLAVSVSIVLYEALRQIGFPPDSLT